MCLICLSFPLFGLIADVKTIVEKGEYNNYFFITGLHTYFECKDNIVLEPSENSTKNSHHSSMRQQYMYMIYLYQGDTPVSFTSHITPRLKYPHTPIPLVVNSSSHPNSEYTWECLQDKNMEFP